jgi:hypothetical protein
MLSASLAFLVVELTPGVQISYRYSTLALLRKPASVAALVLTLFVTRILLRRLEWRIGK